MATLEDIQGSSLVPNLAGALDKGIKGFRDIKDRERKEDLFQESVTQTEIIADPESSADERRSARVKLGLTNPKALNAIEATLAGGNQRVIDQAKLKAEEGTKRAVFVNKGKDVNEKRERWRTIIQDKIAAGEDTPEDMKILSLPNDEFELRMELMEDQGQSIKTLLRDTFEVVPGTGTQRNTRTGELKAIPGADNPAARAVASAKTITVKEGGKEVVKQFNTQTRRFDIPVAATFIKPDIFTIEQGGQKITQRFNRQTGENETIAVAPAVQPTAQKPVSVTLKADDIINFTPDSFQKATSPGGTASDLRLSEQGRQNIQTGTFKLGGNVVSKDAQGKLFMNQTVVQGGVAQVQSVPIAGVLVKRDTGETALELEEREIRTAGRKTRAERMAIINTQADLTNVQRRTKRDLDNIDSAITAAEQVPALRRNLELLETIETGGIDAIVLATARTLGVESGDQAELTFNLRTNVLKQLKPTFGAQFTEREGKLLAEIQGSETKSTKGNIRLMKRAIEIYGRAIERGRRGAERQGDDAALEDIEAFLEPLESLQDEPRRQAGTDRSDTPQPPSGEPGATFTGKRNKGGLAIFQRQDGSLFAVAP